MRPVFPFLLIACLAAPSAFAHPVPAARAVLDLGAGGYVLTLHADVAALVMQATPGHLGEERAEQLRAMSDKELQSWIEDARKALALRLEIAFDHERLKLEEIEFPSPAELRRGATAHNTEGTETIIRIRGKVWDGAQTVALAFPADLGPVRLAVRRGNETLHTLRLAEGQRSGELALKKTETPEAPAAGRDWELALIAAVFTAICGVVGALVWRGRARN